MTRLDLQPANGVAATVGRRGLATAGLAALRPRQWTKNLILFAGLIFAKRFDDAVTWAEAIAIFLAYCAVSSSAYLINDVRDVESDRRHPTKRFRPIAAGELGTQSALWLAAILLSAGATTAVILGLPSFAYLAAFATVQVCYSLVLKRVVLLDVLTIAGLFVIRAAAGAAAINVHISVWLLGCTALLALFLGLAKRRSELMLLAGDLSAGRAVLHRYSVPMLDRALSATAVTVTAVYLLYTLTAQQSDWLVLTVPFVVLGIGRYLHLVHRRDLGEQPEQLLLTDPVILGSVVCWALAAIIAETLS